MPLKNSVCKFCLLDSILKSRLFLVFTFHFPLFTWIPFPSTHRLCVGILTAPPEDQQWFCVKCSSKKKDKKHKKKKHKPHWDYAKKKHIFGDFCGFKSITEHWWHCCKLKEKKCGWSQRWMIFLKKINISAMMLCMLVRKKGFNQQHILGLCSNAVFPTSPVDFLGRLTKPQRHVKTRAY